MEKVPFGKFGFIHKSTSDWMREHLNSIIAIGVGVLAVAGWTLYQWSAGSPGDYLAAERTFNEWSGDRNEKLVKLQKLLKQHPELHAKYDGRIAQKLLLSSQEGLAASFLKAAQKRIGEFSPYYTQFSNCSLLIGEKKIDEALSQSQTLKQALDQDAAFWKTNSEIVRHGAILYGYNLLRIAFLQQMVGNAPGELAAWKDFKREAGWLESEPPLRQLDPESFHLIGQNFQKNDVSLKDFIQYRETILLEQK
jgi:hypothetical protein